MSASLLHDGHYLAEAVGPMSVRVVDGVHGTPADVARAAKLHRRIYGADDSRWRMLTVAPLPDLDPPIDEDAADAAAALARKGPPAVPDDVRVRAQRRQAVMRVLLDKHGLSVPAAQMLTEDMLEAIES
jgi:hypothetical protein